MKIKKEQVSETIEKLKNKKNPNQNKIRNELIKYSGNN